MDAPNFAECRIITPPFTLDEFASLAIADRRPYFDTAAARLNTLPAIIEKDFWVVWTLKHLYDLPDAPPFIFKGGTSLSKAFGIIHRFSEDVDLVIDRRHFGYEGDSDICSAPSASAARKRLAKLDDDIADYIRTDLIPALAQRFNAILTEPFRLEPDPERAQTIFFYYPTDRAHDYLRPMVLIETGGNADHWPVVKRNIRPYVADQFPAAFTSPDVAVTTIDALRTFWEKLTILHKTAHRVDDQPHWEPAYRHSRHYYDVYRLSQAGIVKPALIDEDLIEAVRIAAQTFFADSRARYEEFAPGSIRLIPNEMVTVALRRDYAAMRDMVFGDFPTFDEILAELRQIDGLVNARRR